MPVVDRGDARIWWEAEGEGEPLLLVMGLGYSSDMWYRLLPELTPRFRTIRFDNRGVGRTGVPAGPYPIATMADVPEVKVTIINNPQVGKYGGGSEGANGLAVSAIAAAFLDATGKVPRRMPLKAAYVQAILKA